MEGFGRIMTSLHTTVPSTILEHHVRLSVQELVPRDLLYSLHMDIEIGERAEKKQVSEWR